MNENQGLSRSAEIKGIIGLLKATAGIVEDASLTGAFSKGAPQVIRQYNAVLNRMAADGVLPEGLFPLLADDGTLDEAGVACTQLAGYLKGLPDGGDLPEGSRDLTVTESLRETGQEIRAIMSKKGPAEVAQALREMAGRIEEAEEVNGEAE